LEGIASGIAFAADGRFRKPGFLRPDQSLLAGLRLAEDHPDAYTSRNVTGELGIERSLSKNLTAGLGLAIRFSEIDQFGDTERFGLLSLPGHLDWDTSNDLLNPIRGGRLHMELAPYWDFTGEGLGFVKAYASYSRYIPVTADGDIVLAGRIGSGSIWGESGNEIPADLRFYAGGGGSIRGYAYQSVGPLKQGEPEGGRSLFEISGELRFKITDTLGFVAFLDGGSTFSEATPDLGEDIKWGAVLGLRYYTKLGPLRLDIAAPLDRREGIDDAFQVYFSIGQAF
jgi:translocation and assembly module TamA